MADKRDASDEEVKDLTEQFFVTLRAYVARLEKADGGRSPRAQIDELLQNGMGTWSGAYQIEQFLVDLFDDTSLDVELQARLLEAESNLRPALAAHYVKAASAAKTVEDRRAVLARLVNDLQWRYTVNEVKRTYSKEITRLTSLIFIVAIGLFAAAVVLGAVGSPLLRGDAGFLVLAGLAGGWGASFSMLASLKGRLDAADLNDLKLLRSRWMLWSRPLIGVGAACILYFFLVSGLLGGTAFPDLTNDRPSATSAQTPAPGAAATPAPPGPEAPAQSPRMRLALLVVWCFVAGFSERLVPALLAKTEARVLGQSSVSAERFKPGPADGEAAGNGTGGGRSRGKPDAAPTSASPAAPGSTPEPPRS